MASTSGASAETSVAPPPAGAAPASAGLGASAGPIMPATVRAQTFPSKPAAGPDYRREPFPGRGGGK